MNINLKKINAFLLGTMFLFTSMSSSSKTSAAGHHDKPTTVVKKKEDKKVRLPEFVIILAEISPTRMPRRALDSSMKLPEFIEAHLPKAAKSGIFSDPLCVPSSSPYVFDVETCPTRKATPIRIARFTMSAEVLSHMSYGDIGFYKEDGSDVVKIHQHGGGHIQRFTNAFLSAIKDSGREEKFEFSPEALEHLRRLTVFKDVTTPKEMLELIKSYLDRFTQGENHKALEEFVRACEARRAERRGANVNVFLRFKCPNVGLQFPSPDPSAVVTCDEFELCCFWGIFNAGEPCRFVILSCWPLDPAQRGDKGAGKLLRTFDFKGA